MTRSCNGVARYSPNVDLEPRAFWPLDPSRDLEFLTTKDFLRPVAVRGVVWEFLIPGQTIQGYHLIKVCDFSLTLGGQRSARRRSQHVYFKANWTLFTGKQSNLTTIFLTSYRDHHMTCRSLQKVAFLYLRGKHVIYRSDRSRLSGCRSCRPH